MKYDYKDMAKLMREQDATLIDRAVEIIRRDVKLHGPRLVQQEVQAATPRIPVDRGTYRRSFKFENIPHGALAYNFAPHAPIIELGRRPGARMPPVAAILAWLRRKKLGRMEGPAPAMHTVRQRGERARSYAREQRSQIERAQEHMALQIARRIKGRGLPAHFIMQRASVWLDREIQFSLRKELEGS